MKHINNLVSYMVESTIFIKNGEEAEMEIDSLQRYFDEVEDEIFNDATLSNEYKLFLLNFAKQLRKAWKKMIKENYGNERGEK